MPVAQDGSGLKCPFKSVSSLGQVSIGARLLVNSQAMISILD
jgi:hypothetical protein